MIGKSGAFRGELVLNRRIPTYKNYSIGMGGMMRVMGKIPLALSVMKPLFPVLFLLLLPLMMPKVMPAMRARITERIPMPDYMKEQIAEMMPLVMENLMPHMIRVVVPLISQSTIDFLRGKQQNSRALPG